MDIAETVARFRKDPGSSGFILDFDGTLSPVVSDPSTASMVAGADSVLRDLVSRYAVVAMVSGRRAQDVAERVAVRGLRYIGLHGGEEYLDGEVKQPPDAEDLKRQAASLAQDAAALIESEGLRGCRVERKDMAVSLHFRNAEDPGAGDILLAWAQEHEPSEGFKMALGRKVIEFRPVGFSKASAVEAVVGEHGLRQLLVAGDDLTDVEAMRRAGDMGGLTALRVGVGSAEAPAGLSDQTEVMVGSSEELLQFLRLFLEDA